MKKRNVLKFLMIIGVTILLTGCGKRVSGNEKAAAYKQDEMPEAESESIQESSEEQTFFVHPREREVYIPAADYPLSWEHGTCKRIEEKTVIVSIFLSDSIYSWNAEKEEDALLMSRELDRLTTATEWITKKVAEYGVETEFVFDWNEYSDLKRMVAVDEDICNTENEKLIWSFIENEVDSGELLAKYDAGNILYMIVQNVPKDWDLNALTWIYEEDDYPYEYSLIYPYINGEVVGAASYAHEILHAFGAHDLYIAAENETYVVTEEYLKHLKEIGSRDIMYSVAGLDNRQSGNGIPCDFTPLDAYYIGIADEPEEVEEYGLDKSEY